MRPRRFAGALQSSPESIKSLLNYLALLGGPDVLGYDAQRLADRAGTDTAVDR